MSHYELMAGSRQLMASGHTSSPIVRTLHPPPAAKMCVFTSLPNGWRTLGLESGFLKQMEF